MCIHLGDYPVDPDVVVNTYAVADALREAGAIVEEVELNWTRADIMRAAGAHFGAIFAPSIREDVLAEQFDLLMPYTRAFVEFAEKHARDLTFVQGLTIEGQLYAELGALLDNYTALICPTTAIPALQAGNDYTESNIVVDGVELDDYFETLMTLPFNITSRCPVLSVPSGRARNGVPTGVQIVGPTYDDVSVFRIAAALEQVRPWFSEASWRPAL